MTEPVQPAEAELLSVWPCAQRSSRAQRAGRYTPASIAHPAKMLPAIAAHAITAYTTPGDLVLDPMCGIGTTLIEAVHLGRPAIGIEYEPHWAAAAQANLALARAHGAPAPGRVLIGDARTVDQHLPPDTIGQVALILTSPPYAGSVHGHVTPTTGGGIGKTNDRYSTDPANLAHIGLPALLEAMSAMFTASLAVLRPGGTLAMTLRPIWQAGQLIDLPGRLAATAEHAGLIPYERNVALLAALREDHLVAHPSFFQLEHIRRARAAGLPRQLIAHEDFLAFRAPAAPATWAQDSIRKESR